MHATTTGPVPVTLETTFSNSPVINLPSQTELCSPGAWLARVIQSKSSFI